MNKIPVLCNILLLYFIVIAKTAVGQFAYKADIGEVKQSGFHKILITPALAARSNTDFSDIRITDDSGRFVQYILHRDQPVFDRKELRIIPLVSIQKTYQGNTQLILEISQDTIPITRQESYSFVIVMRKADAYRNASISGSRDMKDWYAINDKIILDARSDKPGDESAQVLLLPPGSYHYLRIEMRDKGLVPLKILRSGLLLNKSIYGTYTMLPAPRIVQKDSSNHKSYIAIHFDETYPVSKIHFAVGAPALYKRDIAVYDTSGIGSRRIADGVAAPGMDSLMLSGEKVKDIVMVVNNNDDLPLRLDSVRAYQLQHFIIANLQQARHYSILTGNNGVAAPVYDLGFFKDSIHLVAEEIIPQTPKPYPVRPADKSVRRNIASSLWIWLSISIVLLSLIWLSVRLIKDISNKQQ
jgi:hypothetical protein